MLKQHLPSLIMEFVVPLRTAEKTVEMKPRGRIQNLKPWKPGQSGNPGGRPRHDVASEIARAVFEGNEEAIYRAMCKALLKGTPKVFQALGRACLRQAHKTRGAFGI